jgi:hypothetical protein
MAVSTFIINRDVLGMLATFFVSLSFFGTFPHLLQNFSCARHKVPVSIVSIVLIVVRFGLCCYMTEMLPGAK